LLTALNVIPPTAEISLRLQEFFESYGLIAVSLISFLENIVGMNAYFPGSIVILVAMAMTAGDVEKALLTFLFIYVPAILAHHVNFLLGRLGSGEKKLENYEASVRKKFTNRRSISYLYLVTFWHPHFTALSCLASGAEGVSYKQFIGWFIIISFSWNVFWGTLMYNIGGLSGREFNFIPIMIGYIILWAIYDYWKYRRIEATNAISG
jgi:membrane protein DedA with SNARE-associated domain